MKGILLLSIIVFSTAMLFPLFTTTVAVLSGHTEIIPSVLSEGTNTAFKFSAITFLGCSAYRVFQYDRKKNRRP